MKKILVLMTVVATALVLSTGAFADPCTNCKCQIRNVPCPSDSQLGPASCLEFDFDINATSANQASNVSDGYCNTVVGAASTLNCRAILHVCDCLPDPTVFIAGLDVGVRMTILVDGVAGDNGAYWSNQNATAGTGIPFDTQLTQSAACAIAAHGDISATTSDDFGPETYLSDGATVAAPLATAACSVPAANRATVLDAINLGAGNGLLTGAEGEYWWIDIKPIRVDPSLLASGATIQVKIELLDDAGTSICGGCTICECTIDVAQMCCSTATPTTTLVFPYFASNASYWRGVAIINPGVTSGTITMTLHDTAGNMATASASAPAGGMFVDSLDNLTWTGAADTNGRCWVSAACNFGAAEGAAMMGAGSTINMGYVVD
jgi:hypothetical protein